MSAMHHDSSPDLKIIDEKLKSIFEISSTTLKARKLVQHACNIICKHGARLAAARMLGVLKKMGRDTPREGERTVIAVDGGLYEHYVEYQQSVESALSELLGPNGPLSVQFEHSIDGSGIGTALLAACYSIPC